MSYNATRKVRTKDLKSLAAKTKTLNDDVKSSVGTLSSLTTSTKTSLVAAVNAVKSLTDTAQSTANTAKTNAATANTNIGTLSSLTTSAKGNLVAAINELVTARGALSSLTTSNKTSIVLAINAVKSLADTAQSTANTAKTNAATANTNIGTLISLTTSDKTTLVAAINELESRLDNEESYINTRSGFHNSFFRGKNLGTAITDAQWTAIRTGAFTDMFVGDYWVIGGRCYRIAHFDYYYNKNMSFAAGNEDSNGDVMPASSVPGYSNTLPHHIVIVPDGAYTPAPMNTSDTKTELYGTCHYRLNARRNIISELESTFGAEHLMCWGEAFTTTLKDYSDGSKRPDGRLWFVCQAELMSTQQLLGYHAINEYYLPVETAYHENIDSGQFALMRLNTAFIRPLDMNGPGGYYAGVSTFMRDVLGVKDDGTIIYAANAGRIAAYSNPLSSQGIRAYFCLIG